MVYVGHRCDMRVTDVVRKGIVLHKTGFRELWMWWRKVMGVRAGLRC